jgi:hypothetical protein
MDSSRPQYWDLKFSTRFEPRRLYEALAHENESASTAEKGIVFVLYVPFILRPLLDDHMIVAPCD